MNKIRPFLKWAGNKYGCIDKILNSLPLGKRLIEPFCGSGAVFINSNYQHYLLGEQNADLINLYKTIQREGLSFIDYCAQFFTQENNSKTFYYQCREDFNSDIPERKKAALFLYLNKHGYNGLCRYNQKGYYNVPFGRFNKPYFPKNELHLFYNKCHTARFIHGDFRQTFKLAQAGDVVYCDPPYVPLSASANFTAYTKKSFNENDQLELVALAMDYANRGICVVLSNHDTEFTRYHYRYGEITSFPVHRYISCKANNRLPVNELVAVFRK